MDSLPLAGWLAPQASGTAAAWRLALLLWLLALRTGLLAAWPAGPQDPSVLTNLRFKAHALRIHSKSMVGDSSLKCQRWSSRNPRLKAQVSMLFSNPTLGDSRLGSILISSNATQVSPLVSRLKCPLAVRRK